MAPMTRVRSTQPGDLPNAMNATYYAQRASAASIEFVEIRRPVCRCERAPKDITLHPQTLPHAPTR